MAQKKTLGFLGVLCVLVAAAVFVGPGWSSAYVASSTNYLLQTDSVNYGGIFSTSSSNYRLEDTIGGIATATTSSSNYKLLAGYQEMSFSSIAITVPDDVSLSPDIDISAGGQANGSVSWTVTASDGYQLAVKAGANPAMQQLDGTSSFSNYSGVTLNWSVANNAARFGFNPYGNDITNTYKNDGSSCGSGSSENGKCWDGFSTSDKTITQAPAGNGATSTTINLRAESGTRSLRPAGSYRATITATATAI